MIRPLLVALCAASLSAQSPGCFATPEAAAQQAVGEATGNRDVSPGVGFQVQDVQFDALTRRVWLRIRPCGNESAPSLLVPVKVRLGSTNSSVISLNGDSDKAMQHAFLASRLPASKLQEVLNEKAITIRAGDSVRVVMTTPMLRMELTGRALEQASIGDAITVSLRRGANEPEQRIHGTARADHTVEVQP